MEEGEGTLAKSLAREVSCTTKRVLLVSRAVRESSAGIDVLAGSIELISIKQQRHATHLLLN